MTAFRNANLFKMIFPFLISGKETWGVEHEDLYPEEEAWISGASRERRQEFIAVRACAREALSCLGLKRPVLIAEPIRGLTWPTGIIGSMTHTKNYRAVAVALRGEFIGIGIDAEPALPLPEGLDKRILVKTEFDTVDSFRDLGEITCWNRLIFSAKESVYKAWAPVAGRFLDFDEVTLTLTPESENTGTFTAQLSCLNPFFVAGGWTISSRLIRTAAWVRKSEFA